MSEQDNMKVETEKFYERFKEIVQAETDATKLMAELKGSLIEDLVKDLIVAEFKEMVYKSIYCGDFEEEILMDTYERIILCYFGENYLKGHKHNSALYERDYLFYEEVEKKGYSVLEWDVPPEVDYDTDGDM